MTGSDSATASSKDNLARIRDNQRRSRARRKEYLQELEAKFRRCEQLGVEASAEIQGAARKVLDENKRLRELLHQKGVSDEEINRFIPNDHDEANFAGEGAKLRQMLVSRKPCSAESGCGSGALRPPAATADQTPVLPRPAQTPATYVPPTEPQSYVPASAPEPVHGSPLSVLAPPSVTATSVSPASATPSTPTYEAHTLQPAYQYPIQTNNGWDYSYQQGYPSGQQPINDYNTSSCVYAANMIRELNPNAGPEVELALGCSSSQGECKVENTVVFNVMDHYISRTVGS